MNLTSNDQGDCRIISVGEDRIDAVVAIQFKDRMRELTDDSPARIVVDMSKVVFLDSSGLGAVVAAMKHVGAGKRLELAGLTMAVAKVFRLTRMDTVFTVHADVATALGAGLADAS